MTKNQGLGARSRDTEINPSFDRGPRNPDPTSRSLEASARVEQIKKENPVPEIRKEKSSWCMSLGRSVDAMASQLGDSRAGLVSFLVVQNHIMSVRSNWSA